MSTKTYWMAMSPGSWGFILGLSEEGFQRFLDTANEDFAMCIRGPYKKKEAAAAAVDRMIHDHANDRSPSHNWPDEDYDLIYEKEGEMVQEMLQNRETIILPGEEHSPMH